MIISGGLLLVLLFVIILTFLYFHFEYKAKYWQRRGVNGPQALPLIGNILDNFSMAINDLEEQRYQKYGRIYGVMQCTTPVLTVGEPELLKQIMITDFHVFMRHRDSFPNDPLLGRMLTELTGDEWKKVRATLSPAFTTGKLKAMQPLIEHCVHQTMNYLSHIESSKGEFDIKKITLAYTLDVIAKCVFGVNTNAIENPNEEFVLKAHDIVNIRLWRVLSTVILPGWLQMKFDMQFFPKKLVGYFKALLSEILRQRRELKQDKVDFVSLLLNSEDKGGNEYAKGLKEKKVKLTEEDIMSNCILFLLAGYETTATFLHFTLYALAMNPQIQEELFREISQYLKENDVIEFDSLNSLPYFDAVFNESMRLYTPVPIFEHICNEDYRLGNLIIERGVKIILPLFAMHRDPEFFPNPHNFIPERFLPENKDSIKPYTFIPFALGPRMCIGNRFSNFHSKLFLANFVKNYEIVKTQNTPEKPEYNGTFVFLTCKPMFATVRRRNMDNSNEITP